MKSADDLFYGIDPKIRLRRAAPAEFADRSRRACLCDVERDARPEPETIPWIGKSAELQRQQLLRQVVGMHQRQRLAAEIAHAVEFAAVRQHLREAQIIARRAENSP